MTDYFTADLHLKHRKVAEIRGFNNVDEHDEKVCRNLTEQLAPGDRLWVLGDISGGREEEDALARLYRLAFMEKVDLHLISGNHDSIHPMHRHSERAHENFRQVFTSIDSMGTFRHSKRKIMLNHFPFGGDHTTTERYPEYRPRDCGVPIIHGHTHSTEQVSHSPAGTLQICVSLDAWGLKPASKESITALLDPHTQEDK